MYTTACIYYNAIVLPEQQVKIMSKVNVIFQKKKIIVIIITSTVYFFRPFVNYKLIIHLKFRFFRLGVRRIVRTYENE